MSEQQIDEAESSRTECVRACVCLCVYGCVCGGGLLAAFIIRLPQWRVAGEYGVYTLGLLKPAALLTPCIYMMATSAAFSLEVRSSTNHK